jgi:hypothetical protein
LACREKTGVGHRVEVGPQSMQLITMGDLIAADVCVYREKRTFNPRVDWSSVVAAAPHPA